jgi:hypothetical protein
VGLRRAGVAIKNENDYHLLTMTISRLHTEVWTLAVG